MTISLPKKTQGFDFNFYQKITVTWNDFGVGSPNAPNSDMLITFSTQGLLILNEDNSSIVQVSFNGNTIHDELNPVLPSRGIAYDNRVVSGIWFKLVSGSSAIISVRAWGIR